MPWPHIITVSSSAIRLVLASERVIGERNYLDAFATGSPVMTSRERGRYRTIQLLRIRERIKMSVVITYRFGELELLVLGLGN